MEIVNINYQECPMHPMHPMLYALSVVNKAIAKLIATTTRQKAKRLKEDANEHFPIRFTYYPLVKLKKWFSRLLHLLASPQKTKTSTAQNGPIRRKSHLRQIPRRKPN